MLFLGVGILLVTDDVRWHRRKYVQKAMREKLVLSAMCNHHRRQILDRCRALEDHVQTVLHLVEADRSCVEILMLALALRREIREMAGLLLAKHLSYCAAMAIYGEHAAERERVISELLQLLHSGLRPAEQHVGERFGHLAHSDPLEKTSCPYPSTLPC